MAKKGQEPEQLDLIDFMEYMEGRKALGSKRADLNQQAGTLRQKVGGAGRQWGFQAMERLANRADSVKSFGFAEAVEARDAFNEAFESWEGERKSTQEGDDWAEAAGS